MKDTSVPWLGQVPKHWQPMRFAYLVEFRKGLSITKADLRDAGVPCVSYGEVHSKYAFEVNPEKHHLKCVEERFLTESPRSLLTNGDFVFADTSEDVAGSGNFTYLNSESRIFAGYHTIIARPKAPIHHRYLAYQLDTKAYRAQIQSQVSGVKVFSITKEILRNLVLYLPPLDEQRAIAAFLDHKTAQIDSLIDKKRRMIELLKEKRTALISHAVTKGLNPDAPMKDSGVPWLGHVPAHWEVKRLRFVCKMAGGVTPNTMEAGYWGGSIPWVSPKDMKSAVIEDSIDHVTEVALAETGLKMLEKATLLVVVRGMILIHSFPVAITSLPVTINQDMKALTNLDGINVKYLQSILNSAADYIVNMLVETAGHGTKKLNTDLFASLKIVRPPMEEQRTINDYLEAETRKIDILTEKIDRALDRLQEYRTTIISAAVTGQIDVRNHGAA